MFNFSRNPALAYDTSRWDRCLYDARRGEGLQIKETEIRAALVPHRDVVGQTAQETSAKVAEVGEEATTFGAEVFSRLYSDPGKIDSASGWAPVAHKILDELPEWSVLRESVSGDPDFSALATKELLSVIGEKLPAILEEIKKEEGKQPSKNGQEGGGDTPGSKHLGPAGQRARAALRGAIDNAGKMVASAKEAMAGLAPGSEYAPPTHMQKDPARLKLAEALLRNPDLREIVRRAGKLTRLAVRKEMTRDPHARGQVVGLETGNDLGRVLPSELALMDDPDLDVLFYKKFAEGALFQYRVEGKEPMGKGPIIVLLDKSGSMSGDPEKWAVAAAIACMGVAKKEKREAIIAFFSTRISEAWVQFPTGKVSKVHAKTGEIGPEWGDATRLAMELCGRGSGGGTDFSQPLSWALGIIETRQPKADILFVTDGYADASPAVSERICAARQKGLRLFGLTVNGGAIQASMRTLCTGTVDLDGDPKKLDERIAAAIPTRPE